MHPLRQNLTDPGPGLRRLTIGLTWAGLMGCGDSTEPIPTPTNAGLASLVRLDDVANTGNASDLVITFAGAGDETTVAEYRVIVVNEANQAGFSLAAAEGRALDRLTVVIPGTGNYSVSPTATTLDADGNPITEGTTYVAYVLSIASDPEGSNALALPSNAVPLATTTIKITYLGNAGVMVADDNNAVVIDGLTGNLSGWIPVDADAQSRLLQSSDEFADLSVAFSTHNHGDHHSPSAVSTFLSNTPAAVFVGPVSTRSGVSPSSRVVDLSPLRGERADTTINGIPVSILHVRHFDQFGNNFSSVDNFGVLVELGGLKVLHLGDVQYLESNLNTFGLDTEGIDVVILPTFNTLVSQANAELIASVIAPTHVIALHFQQNQVSNESQQADGFFGGVTAFTASLQFARF